MAPSAPNAEKDDDFHRTAWSLAREMIEDTFSIDARFLTTFWELFRHPGAVARGWSEGKRQTYASPFRFYLAISLILFLLMSLGGEHFVVVNIGGSPPLSSQSSIPTQLAGQKAKAEPTWLEHIKSQIRAELKKASDDKAGFDRAFNEWLPRIAFFMVPVLALLLRLFYWRKTLFFIDHLAFSFYLHAGLFVFLIVGNLLPSYAGNLTLAAALVFVIWSACGYYRQSVWLTLIKWLFMSAIYVATLGLATTVA
ncbi:MAG: DUF3667 domain-containing protein, partial [Alphaproteobacteria bacterium]